MAVAIFSLYSVHLLLKTANEGGEPHQECVFPNLPLASSKSFRTLTLFFVSFLKVHWCTSSWVTKPSGCRGNSPPPSPSPCRTSEVRGCGTLTARENLCLEVLRNCNRTAAPTVHLFHELKHCSSVSKLTE